MYSHFFLNINIHYLNRTINFNIVRSGQTVVTRLHGNQIFANELVKQFESILNPKSNRQNFLFVISVSFFRFSLCFKCVSNLCVSNRTVLCRSESIQKLELTHTTKFTLLHLKLIHKLIFFR